jgi:hypothetical protein
MDSVDHSRVFIGYMNDNEFPDYLRRIYHEQVIEHLDSLYDYLLFIRDMNPENKHLNSVLDLSLVGRIINALHARFFNYISVVFRDSSETDDNSQTQQSTVEMRISINCKDYDMLLYTGVNPHNFITQIVSDYICQHVPDSYEVILETVTTTNYEGPNIDFRCQLILSPLECKQGKFTDKSKRSAEPVFDLDAIMSLVENK